MNFERHITDIFEDRDDYNLAFAKSSTKIAALYVYYHYFNADVARLDEVWECLSNTLQDESFIIKSILKSIVADNTVDFNCCLSKSDFEKMSIKEICDNIKKISLMVGYIVYHDSSKIDKKLIDQYDDLSIKLNEDTGFLIRVICPADLKIENKLEVQQKVSEITVANKNVMFEILFSDDLEQEVSDVENPKEFVPSGSIKLLNKNVVSFGSEKSFISIISAKSIKQLFLKYSTRGLFASNLRFYITSKKIDSKIVNTISNESSNFCYFNNGIIITCDDFKIVDDTVLLTNFSIVNGGQTTNLIGRTAFDKDFAVICKFIKNKYPEKKEREEFLSKVAEASNMQKPINAKDLIANRIEQRMLKLQFAEAGMFLKIKRGEKIDKTLYPEAYMNAANDEIAQMLYSCVFQSPGAAKNSKSGIIGNDKTYNLIFKNKYSNDFLKSIQIIKVSYSDWQKKISREEPHNTVLYGLSRHANYYTAALLSFFLKIIINNEIRTKLLSLKASETNDRNVEFKSLLRINDIGTVSMLDPNAFAKVTKSSFFDLFEYVFKKILTPAYLKFKRAFPNYAYSQFFKSDQYYYNFLLPEAKSFISSKANCTELNNYMILFNLSGSVSVAPTNTPEEISAESLEEDLKVFRKGINDKSNKTIKIYDVLKNMQLAKIVRVFPTTLESLKTDCEMSDDQINLYGEEILNIVKKYIKLEDFS